MYSNMSWRNVHVCLYKKPSEEAFIDGRRYTIIQVYDKTIFRGKAANRL